jgi:superfamily II RNA helicase
MEVVDDKIEKLMKAEINIRDAISDLENQVKELKAKREMIQSALNDICRQRNVDGLKTSVGTLTRGVKSRYWTDDWPSMYKFLKEHDALDLMEKRVAQGNMKEFLEANPGLLPPGLQQQNEFSIVIRRNRDNKEQHNE